MREPEDANINDSNSKVLNSHRILQNASFEVSDSQFDSSNNENLESSKIIEIKDINPSFVSRSLSSQELSKEVDSEGESIINQSRHMKEEVKQNDKSISNGGEKPEFAKPTIITQERGNSKFYYSTLF